MAGQIKWITNQIKAKQRQHLCLMMFTKGNGEKNLR